MLRSEEPRMPSTLIADTTFLAKPRRLMPGYIGKCNSQLVIAREAELKDRDVHLTVPVGALTLGCEVTAFAACMAEDRLRRRHRLPMETVVFRLVPLARQAIGNEGVPVRPSDIDRSNQ